MHIHAGVTSPDAGRIDFAGHENVKIQNEHAAQRLGISIVFQERSLFGDLIATTEEAWDGIVASNLVGRLVSASVADRRRTALLAEVRRTGAEAPATPDQAFAVLGFAAVSLASRRGAVALAANRVKRILLPLCAASALAWASGCSCRGAPGAAAAMSTLTVT